MAKEETPRQDAVRATGHIRSRLIPDEVELSSAATVGWAGPSLVIANGTRVSVVDTEGSITACDVGSPVRGVSSGSAQAVLLCGPADAGGVLTIDREGVVEERDGASEGVVNARQVGDSLILVRSATAVLPAAAVVLAAGGKVRATIPLPAAQGDTTIEECADGSVIVSNRRCKTWWRIDLKKCVLVETGDGSAAAECEGGATSGGPDGVVRRPGPDPCVAQLGFPIGSLAARFGALAAFSADRRFLTLLNPDSLETIHEYQFSSHGAAITFDPEQPLLHAFDYRRRAWLEFDLSLIFDTSGADDAEPPGEPAVFAGTSQALIAGRPPTTGDHKILAIPLLEPGQTIGGEEGIPTYIQSEIIEPVAAFYADASYEELAVSADVYGFEGVAPDAGPLTLLNHFEDFWYGDIEPGGFRVRIRDVADPPTIAFDGTEELVVRINDPGDGLVDQELLIQPAAARLLVPADVDSMGAGSITIPSGSIGVVFTEVDDAALPQVLALTASTYSLPAQLGDLEADVNRALLDGWAGDDQRKLRTRCRITAPDRSVNIDLYFENAAPSSRRISEIVVADLPASTRVELGTFRYSSMPALDSRFALEGYLEDAVTSAEVDAGLMPGSLSLLRVRVNRVDRTLTSSFELRSFTGTLDLVRQSGFELLGFDVPTASARKIEAEAELAEEPEPLRLDGSETASITTDRGLNFDLRVPAVRGRGTIPPGAAELDFDGTTGSLTIDSETVTLTFPAETVPIAGLTTYLNDVFSSAGLPSADRIEAEVTVMSDGTLLTRLFFVEAPPAGEGPRRVSLTITDGPSLAGFLLGLTSPMYTAPVTVGGAGVVADFAAAVVGVPLVEPTPTTEDLDLVLEFAFDLTQAGDGNSAVVVDNRGLDRYGFDDATPVIGTDASAGEQWTPRSFRDIGDDPGIGTDVVTALHRRHRDEIDDVLTAINGYQSIMLVLIGSPPPGAAWTSSPSTLSEQRAFATRNSVHSRDDEDILLHSNWMTVFLEGSNKLATTGHEFGHVIGLYDLYEIRGVHRPDLNYLDDFCLMDNSPVLNTICGYHKLGAAWVDEPVESALEAERTEALLIPLEYASVADEGAVRAQFPGVAAATATLMKISLGSGAAPFGLVEARQERGADYGQRLAPDGEVLVSHCLSHDDDTRLRETAGYRRQAQRLTRAGQLTDPGDEIPLGALPTLSIGGTTVQVLDKQPVSVAGETFNVFHVAILREEAQTLDLFFQDPVPSWRSPDAWVDDPANGEEIYELGEPRDQGDVIRVPEMADMDPFQHHLVARVHNGSSFAVPRARVAFYLCKPPGSGDWGNFVKIGESNTGAIPDGGTSLAEVDWDVRYGFDAHQCMRVELIDWELPPVGPGDPGFTDDITERNNWAQKNFVQFESRSGSPFEPVLTQYSVANDGPDPELARLEAVGLAPGMKIRIWPAEQWIAPESTALFACELTLDEDIVKPDCSADRQYAIVAWRQSGDAWEPWGGVQYLVQPRKKTATSLEGELAYGRLRLHGSVTPSPRFGTVELQLRADDGTEIIEKVGLTSRGHFEHHVEDVDFDRAKVVAKFLGNAEWASSVSDPLTLRHARLI